MWARPPCSLPFLPSSGSAAAADMDSPAQQCDGRGRRGRRCSDRERERESALNCLRARACVRACACAAVVVVVVLCLASNLHPVLSIERPGKNVGRGRRGTDRSLHSATEEEEGGRYSRSAGTFLEETVKVIRRYKSRRSTRRVRRRKGSTSAGPREN